MGVGGAEQSTGFVGRQRVLDALGAVVGDASSGRGRVVVIEGEAGIGKSRLLDEALSGAAGRGFRVASQRVRRT